MANTPPFTLRLDKTLRGEVQKMAAEFGVSESEVVRRILSNHVEDPSLSQRTQVETCEAKASTREEVAA